jgi:hypothetical protein
MRIFKFYPIGQAKKAFAAWNFDCNAFSTAFTSFYNHHFFDDVESIRHYNIGLRIDNKDEEACGLYELGGSIFLCNQNMSILPEKQFEIQLFKTLLHEIMHWIQYTFYKWSDEEIVKGEEDQKCAAELMCRKFEKQFRHILKIYRALLRVKKHEYRC